MNAREQRVAMVIQWFAYLVAGFVIGGAIAWALLGNAHAGDYETCTARGNAKCAQRFPTPTPTVKPTPRSRDCSTGTFVFDAKAGLWTYKLTPEPGRTYHLCADVPVRAPVPVALELKTQNRSNGSCDIYAITAFAPSNYSAKPLPVSEQPGFPFKYEGGRWQFDVVLIDGEPDNPVCSSPHGLVLYLWSW